MAAPNLDDRLVELHTLRASFLSLPSSSRNRTPEYSTRGPARVIHAALPIPAPAPQRLRPGLGRPAGEADLDGRQRSCPLKVTVPQRALERRAPNVCFGHAYSRDCGSGLSRPRGRGRRRGADMQQQLQQRAVEVRVAVEVRADGFGGHRCPLPSAARRATRPWHASAASPYRPRAR
jgi:hypothetical protein